MIAINVQTPEEKAAGKWTISSRIADALSTAESRFGPRDCLFKLAGYRYEGAIPTINLNFASMTAEIFLAAQAAGNTPSEIHMGAHEVVHLLGPCHPSRPTNFEEGLATLFAEQYTEGATGLVAANPPDNYRRARDAVRAFLLTDEILRKIRAEEPVFAKFTPGLLTKQQPACTPEEAEFLCANFHAA